MTSLTSRSARVVSLSVALLLLFSGAVLAQTETTVSAETRERSRQLSVRDLSGQDLQSVQLRDGIPSAFQVRVTDDDIELTTDDFFVQATMNHLYRSTGEGSWDPASRIDASAVDVGFVTDPLAASDLLADLAPSHLLGDAGAITCTKVETLLGTDFLGQLTDPICSLLTELDLLGLLTNGGLEFDNLPITGLPVGPLSLDDLALADLPIVINHGPGGVFTNPNCSSGIAALVGDATCDEGTGATARVLMQGAMAGSLTANLDALLRDALPTPIVHATDASISTVNDIIAALRNDSRAKVRDLGDALADTAYTDAQRITLINGLLAAVENLVFDDLLYLDGQYRSLPTLSIDTGSADQGGVYEGTMTVTLVDGSLPN